MLLLLSLYLGLILPGIGPYFIMIPVLPMFTWIPLLCCSCPGHGPQTAAVLSWAWYSTAAGYTLYLCYVLPMVYIVLLLYDYVLCCVLYDYDHVCYSTLENPCVY